MKVRIKKIIDSYFKYEVQYKKFGLFWKTFDKTGSYENALKGAERLQKWHGTYTIEEFRKLEESEKDE